MDQRIASAAPPGDDRDGLFFEQHPEARQRLRPADPGEWPEGNELLTTPPFTLVVSIEPGTLLKLGVWRNTAAAENTFLQLSRGRISISTYLQHIRGRRG